MLVVYSLVVYSPPEGTWTAATSGARRRCGQSTAAIGRAG
jgi:hypothetical protein